MMCFSFSPSEILGGLGYAVSNMAISTAEVVAYYGVKSLFSPATLLPAEDSSVACPDGGIIPWTELQSEDPQWMVQCSNYDTHIFIIIDGVMVGAFASASMLARFACAPRTGDVLSAECAAKAGLGLGLQACWLVGAVSIPVGDVGMARCTFDMAAGGAICFLMAPFSALRRGVHTVLPGAKDDPATETAVLLGGEGGGTPVGSSSRDYVALPVEAAVPRTWAGAFHDLVSWTVGARTSDVTVSGVAGAAPVGAATLAQPESI